MKVRYRVRAQAIKQDGNRYALIEVIDESKCKNKWRINPAGKPRALESLMTTPPLGPPEHGQEAVNIVGRPYDFESDCTTSFLCESPHLEDWQRIDSGEWGARLNFLASLRR